MCGSHQPNLTQAEINEEKRLERQNDGAGSGCGSGEVVSLGTAMNKRTLVVVAGVVCR